MVGKNGRDEFDMKHRVDTGGKISLWALNVNSPNARFGIQYGAIGEDSLRNALKYIAAGEDLNKFSFVDVGCGKGRPLLIANDFNFRQLIGVEFVPSLAEIARSNIIKLDIKNAVVVEGDATVYPFPKEDMVIFLYNPFLRPVMEKMVNNLKNSMGGKLFVIYAHPNEQCLDLFNFLTQLNYPGSYVKIWKNA